MTRSLTFLYRGALASCNYRCCYCPFAKRQESSAEHEADEAALDRFVSWVIERRGRSAVFFIPFGEALVHRRYQRAIARLSHAPQVERVAIQTNLHGSLDFLSETNTAALGLWCTYHPGQSSHERFLSQCQRLDANQVSYSVGMVGVREHFDQIAELRASLSPERYLWINAFKREPDYYRPEEIERLRAIDPLFGLNLRPHPSRGAECHAGQSVFAVDGEGNVRPCPFVDEALGNIYGAFEPRLAPYRCPKACCGCHIGYVHLKHLKLYPLYGRHVLERIAARSLLFGSYMG